MSLMKVLEPMNLENNRQTTTTVKTIIIGGNNENGKIGTKFMG